MSDSPREEKLVRLANHPGGKLGYHVAILRIAKRLMCDGGAEPTDISALFERRNNRDHGRLMRAVVKAAVGREVYPISAASEGDLLAAGLIQIEELGKKTNRPHAWFPSGWEQSRDWLLKQARRRKK